MIGRKISSYHKKPLKKKRKETLKKGERNTKIRRSKLFFLKKAKETVKKNKLGNTAKKRGRGSFYKNRKKTLKNAE